MVGYWGNIVREQAQPRHNVVVLDASIINSLYKMERRATTQGVPALGSPDALVACERDKTLLFSPALEMCLQGKNLLVIPEAVLREVYGRKTYARKAPPPFVERHGVFKWSDSLMQAIDHGDMPLTTTWDDRGLLFTRFLKQAQEKGALHVCHSRADFMQAFGHTDGGPAIVIVRDRLRPGVDHSAGDEAIRALFESMSDDRLAFKNLSVLSSDVGLRGSLLPIEQEFLSVDTGILMDAFTKYNALSPGAGVHWSRGDMNALFARSDFRSMGGRDGQERQYRIGRAIGMQGDIFLKVLGHHEAVSKDSGMAR